MSTIEVPRHIYWSCRERVSIDPDDEEQRRWLLEKTLTHGTIHDILLLDLCELEEALPGLNLPEHVRALWRDYFDAEHSNAVS